MGVAHSATYVTGIVQHLYLTKALVRTEVTPYSYIPSSTEDNTAKDQLPIKSFEMNLYDIQVSSYSMNGNLMSIQ